MNAKDRVEWEDIMLKLDKEFIQIKRKGRSIEEEIQTSKSSSPLIPLISEIGNKSNIPFSDEGVLIVISCLKSYYLGTISKSEFIKTITKPNKELINGAKIFLNS